MPGTGGEQDALAHDSPGGGLIGATPAWSRDNEIRNRLERTTFESEKHTMTTTRIGNDLRWIPLEDEPSRETGTEVVDAPGLEEKLALISEPFPPREADSPEELEPLRRSIEHFGILTPLLLRRVAGRAQVVCGWRRLLAARSLGLARVPALVVEHDDAEAIRAHHEEARLQNPSRAVGLPDQGGAIQRFPLTPTAPVESPELIDLTRDADGSGAGSTLIVEEALDRVIVRATAFFDEVRVTRSINVPRTEILADSIVEIAEMPGPLLALGFHRPLEGDFTAPHSVLVTQLCVRVARLLGWDEDTSRSFVLGGLLHDVGMTFVRETAARAAGALSPTEIRAIQSHTRIGCALVAGAKEWPEVVAHMARDHHERWNGTGYPEGSKGTEIPFLARVLGLLDTYAALVTPRPHRAALDPGFARERLLGAMERGLIDPSLSSVVTLTLPECSLELAPRDRDRTPPPLTRNSVELRGDLVTMLAKGST